MDAKILVIDDEQGVLDSIGEVLSDEGFNICLLNDDAMISSVVKSYQPDLILLDIALNNSDGRDVCRDLKKSVETQNIPVIMISGTYDLASALRTNSSPDDFIEKPLDMRILLSKINNLLLSNPEDIIMN